MATLNESNKATVLYTSAPSLTTLINDLTSLRDSTGVPGTALLTVLIATDGDGVKHTTIVVDDPVFIFEWDESI